MTLIIMAVGMIASGFAVVFVKFGTIDPFTLAAYRLILSALILSPLFFRDLKATGEPFRFTRILPSVLPGIFLGFHFIFWIMGARMIPGGHASVIVTMSPVIMPFLMFFMIKEKITLLETTGSLLALGGAFFLGLKDSEYALSYIKGDILVFISMLMVTLYLALARKNRKSSSLWCYMIPLYISGGIVCLIIALISGAELLPRTQGDIISISGLVLICTVIGHSVNNYGMRKLRGQIVSLLNLTQIIISTVLAYIFLGEIPPIYFYPAALLVLSGPLIVILFDKGENPD